MNDAGDFNGRADPVADVSLPRLKEGETPEGLSKRAARRRRKRRAAAGENAAGGAPRESAPKLTERPVLRREEAKPKDGAVRRGRRARRNKPAGPPQPDLRGVRQTQHQHGPARSGDGRRGEAEARREGFRRPEARRPDGEARSRPAERGPDHRRRSSHGGMPLYAALDLGTNNCRLLIAEPQERGFRVVDAFSRIVRLGEGIGRSGRLAEAAMDRAVEALAVCRHKMADHDVRRMRLVATEACRAAENGVLFLERVRAETGLALEIVDRETEARLAVAGCATLVDPRAEGVLLFDIGGGSSELVWLDLRNRGEARGFALTRFIKAWTSLPVGVVTLSERHGGVTVTPAVFEAMVEEVVGMLDGFPGAEDIAPVLARGGVHMLGTSGTVTTLAGVALGLERYRRPLIDGAMLDREAAAAALAALRGMGREGLARHPCVGPERAEFVLPGCAIYAAIASLWPAGRVTVADRGLREGMLMRMIRADRRGRQDKRSGGAVKQRGTGAAHRS